VAEAALVPRELQTYFWRRLQQRLCQDGRGETLAITFAFAPRAHALRSALSISHNGEVGLALYCNTSRKSRFVATVSVVVANYELTVVVLDSNLSEAIV